MNPKVRSCGNGKRDGGYSRLPHVCMFVNNTGVRDPRVTREAEVAVEAGFRVTVVAAQRHDENVPVRRIQRGVTFLTPKVGRSKVVGLARRLFSGGNRERPVVRSAAQPREKSSPGRAHPGLLKSVSICLWTWRRRLIDTLQRLRLGLATNADIYHAHDCDTLGIAWVCSRLRSRPLVYDSHELWVDWQGMRGASRATVEAWRVLERALVRQCDLCITVSDGLSAILRERYAPRRLVVVRNCPRRPREHHPIDRVQARDACGIEQQAKVVLFQGGIFRYRGLETLLKAAAELPEVRFLIVGRLNEYSAELEKLARRHGRANVVFLGHKDEAERNMLMSAADLGTALIQDRSLSYRHSFANKNAEYFRNGLPVLASDLPEHRSVICRTGTGLLADPEDSADVAEKIREFFSLDEKTRRTMSERGRSAVAREFNMEKQMEPVLRFYATVCPERRR